MCFIWFLLLLTFLMMATLIAWLTLICYISAFITLILRLRRRFIAFQMLLFQIWLIFAWTFLLFISFLSCLLFVLLHHLFELPMLSNLLLLFLFLIQLPFFSLFLKASSSPCFSISSFILKYWLIVNIL